MSILGLIPARSGSKGVRNKNIRLLGDKPLIAYTIEAALQSRVDRVVVSTESTEYAQIARQYGAEVPFMRPSELACDTIAAIAVLGHAVDWFAENERWCPDAVFYLQPTSPFRKAEHIDAAIDRLIPEVDSVISVTAPTDHPYYMFEPTAKGRMVPFVEISPRPERRQDLPLVFALNDAIMASHMRYLRRAMQSGGLVVNMDNFAPLSLEGAATLDINEEEDFVFADYLVSRRDADV